MSTTRSEEKVASGQFLMKMIHIKQIHEAPILEPAFVTEPREMEITVESQFQVAQELRKYKECPIVVEGNYKDEQDPKSQPLAAPAKKIFPEGFPSNYNKLTTLQKEFLYDKGAARTLFYLGEIPAIYKCTHHDELADNKEFFKRFMNSFKSHPADDKRELCLLSTKEEDDINIKSGKIYIKPLKNALEYALLDNDDKTIYRGKITAEELGKKIDESMLKDDSRQIIKKCKPMLIRIVKIIKNRGHLSDRLKSIFALKTLDLQEYVFDSREKEAIECAKEAAIQHYGKLENAQVIIVFGAAHNFKPHFDKEGITYEVIDASKMQKQIEVSSSPSSFFNFSKQLERASAYLKEREIRKELQSLFQKRLY